MKKAHLITPINIERMNDGMSFDEVVEASKELHRMTVAQLQELLKNERAARRVS